MLNVAASAKDAVLQKTKADPTLLKEKVSGYDFNKGIDYEKILNSYLNVGFQATNFGFAIAEINRMIQCRKAPMPKGFKPDDEDPKIRNNCTIFLAYTSNMVSCGIRETIRFLVQHKMVDCLVTTTGGIEEDIMKCMGSLYLGDFAYDDVELRTKMINRIANLLMPNDNYIKFEEWFMPVLDEMLEEQKQNGVLWSPSKVIRKLGLKINNEESILYWAAKNEIPVFCPALTDGSMGDMMFMHSYQNPGLVLDIISDIRKMDLLAMKSINSAMLIIGGGLAKHHTCNANSLRKGADYAVYINTSSEFDGSDGGAPPKEAKSWGKIKPEAKPVKVYADATLVFPLLVAQTFAKEFHSGK